MNTDLVLHLRELQRNADWEGLDKMLQDNSELEFSEDPDILLVLTLCALLREDPQRADGFLASLDPDKIESTQAISDYGLVCLVTGRQEEALEWLEKATGRLDADGTAYARLGSLYMMRGELDKAQKLYEQSLLLDPEKPEVLSNLGGLMLRRGELVEAADLYERAITLKPDLQVAREQRNRVLIQLNRSEEVVEERQEQLKKDPEDSESHEQLGAALQQTGRLQEGEAVLEAAIDRFPDNEKLRRSFIQLLFSASKHNKAGVLLKQWLEDEDQRWDEDFRIRLRFLLNEARIECKFLDAAETDLEDLREQAEHHSEFGLFLAKLRIEQMRGEEAVPILEDLLERYPGLVQAYNLLSQTLSSLGRMEEARKYSDMVASINPGAIAQHVENRDYQANESQIRAMHRLFDNPVFDQRVRASVGFTLHKVLDKREDFEEAFEVLARANELIRETLGYDWRTHRRMIQRTMEIFTPELVESLKGLGHKSVRPIFVVGMPRSGTTLTEQILGAHSRVYGVGELPHVGRIARLMPKALGTSKIWPEAMKEMSAQDLKNAGAYYLEKVALHDETAPHIADKMPHNFDYVGLIALMFPRARIIHLDREPMDTALSNFQQNFGAAHGTMGFAFDLTWIGHMLNDHDRIMQHWQECFPGRIFELNYERLVADPEPTIRELLEFCELPWEDNVMQFSKNPYQVRTASVRQVRRGIFTSSAQKWKRYESRFEPVLSLLKEGFQPIEEASQADDEDVVSPFGLLGVTR